MWRGPTDAGFTQRPLGLHERTEEILAGSFILVLVLLGTLIVLDEDQP